GRLIWVRLLSSAARPVLWILRDELLGNPPPPAQVLPSTSSLTWRPGGSLASSHQAWSTWSPDSVLGVISSGSRRARTFCEHLTALYAVECSKRIRTRSSARAQVGRPEGAHLATLMSWFLPFARQAAREPAH